MLVASTVHYGILYWYALCGSEAGLPELRSLGILALSRCMLRRDRMRLTPRCRKATLFMFHFIFYDSKYESPNANSFISNDKSINLTKTCPKLTDEELSGALHCSL